MGLFAEDEKQIDLVEGRNGLYHGRKVKSGNESNIINDCKYCSFTHQKGRCPAYNKICNKCGNKGHFASRCYSKRVVKEILQEQASDNNGEDIFFIGAVDDHKHGNLADDKLEPFHVDMIDGDWNVDLNASGSMINFKIDTGAQIDVLPHREYLKLYKRPKLVKTATKLKAYNGTPISVVGKYFVEVRHKGEVLQIPFIVADTQAAPILGLQTSSRFQLIKRIESVTRSMPNYINGFNDSFGELGKLPKVHHITMKNNAVPMVHPPRRIPIAIQDKVKHELNRMVKLKVIEKITEPTDWVSSMVTVQKPNGSLRICSDPKDLNLAIKRQHFPMATASWLVGVQCLHK